MKRDAPLFGLKDQLARYIEPDFRQGSGRARIGAFYEDASATQNGLSVNSLEVHTQNEIAAIYQEKFNDPRPLAMTIHTVEQYVKAATEAEISIQYNEDRAAWLHEHNGNQEKSFVLDRKKSNSSHCLVTFTKRLTSDYQKMRFARRMAHKPTYKLV